MTTKKTAKKNTAAAVTNKALNAIDKMEVSDEIKDLKIGTLISTLPVTEIQPGAPLRDKIDESREVIADDPVEAPAQDSRLIRDTENGVELYAKIVQLSKNKRYVIVCPFVDGFSPGRMVVPKRGQNRKVMVKTDDGWIEKAVPGKFTKRGNKFWVRLVDAEQGLYEFVK